MELLKGLGIGKEVGTEQTAQKLWMKFLGRFDYKPDQAFPDNMTKGTNRITGNVKAGRKTSIVNHLFNPTFITYTYADLEHGIPLYTRTRGTTAGDLACWSGIIGMRDVVGNRFPTADPKKTEIRRKTEEGRSMVGETIRAIDILERKGEKFTGDMPPPQWMDEFKSIAEMEDWLQENYPEYQKWLVENLHQPIEAEGFLYDLNISKDRAAFVKRVEILIKKEYPDLFDKVLDDAVEFDNDIWQFVVLANKGMIPHMVKRGFIPLEKNDAFNRIINSSKTSNFVKEALKNVKSDGGKISERSAYYIRLPNGTTLDEWEATKEKWMDTLTNEYTGVNPMFDDIKKEDKKKWYDILKAPEYEDKDEEEQKDSGSAKRPKVPEKVGSLEERELGRGEVFDDDWKTETGIDTITGKRKDATGVERDRGYTGTDSLCFTKLKEILKWYIEKTRPGISKGVVDKYLECHQIEADVPTEQYLVIMGDDSSFNYSDDEELFKIDVTETSVFHRWAGEGPILPKEIWEDKPGGFGSPPTDGASIRQWWDWCIKEQVKHSPTTPRRIGERGTVEIDGEEHSLSTAERFDDIELTPAEKRRLKKEAIAVWIGKGNKNPERSRLEQSKMAQEEPELYAMFMGTSLISDTGKLTLAEMKANTKMRERLWDYEDEVSRLIADKKGKQFKPIARGHDKIDADWGLEDYEFSATGTYKEMFLWIEEGEPNCKTLLDIMEERDWMRKVEVKDWRKDDPPNEVIGVPMLEHNDNFIPGPEIIKYLIKVFGR